MTLSIAQKKVPTLGVEAYIAILAIVCIILHLIFRFSAPSLQEYPLYITLALG